MRVGHVRQRRSAGSADSSALVHRLAAAVGLCAISVAGLVGVATPALASGASWFIVTSPNIPMHHTELSSVTCVSGSDCWAVGAVSTDSLSQTLTEHWDGSTWSVVTSPDSSPAQFNSLTSVACASGSDCWAVGLAYTSTYSSAISQTLVEHWDGTAWSIVASPSTTNTQSNYVGSVTCVSSSDCWMVGEVDIGYFQTLIEHWDGSAWSIVASPDTSPLARNGLDSVSCTSESNCWAVGSAFGALVEHWDGTIWSIVAGGNAGVQAGLSSVTCISSADCWAVGAVLQTNNDDQTLTEHWNGSAWSVVASGNTSRRKPNSLTSVACASSSDCSAVGNAFHGSVQQTLAEHWNGSVWSIVASADTGPTELNALVSVACAFNAGCWSVGVATPSGGGGLQALIEHYGSTTVVISPTNGAAGTPVTVQGTGFASGETVNVTYKTGLSAPEPTKVTLCSTTVMADGTFTCGGNIPTSGDGGAAGSHKVVAKGATSLTKATTTFMLT
jgi:hypothetical protein